MKITKFGHCCLVIEERGLTILTDPGAYSTAQNQAKGVDIVLITHEHADHLHVGSLKEVLANNPAAEVLTNKGVGQILDKEGIRYTLVGHGQTVERKGVRIEGFGMDHWPMYQGLKVVENTAYFIGDRLFYPGDSFADPQKPIDILALPVAGPWATLSECVDYAKKMKPKFAFPVHEGMLMPDKLGPVHRVPESVLVPLGIQFVVIKEGESREF
ncbi:MAG: MBL fold metallo-hydrolase [Candidatus Taylorbacteria bacterium]|nr:MBL fold metallo-hydrolase [Candidatus Taylorbacteria bacterium]